MMRMKRAGPAALEAVFFGCDWLEKRGEWPTTNGTNFHNLGLNMI